MASETLKTRVCKVLIENGTDSEGNIKTTSQSIGALSTERWNGDKALAIVSALAPCLASTVESVETVVTANLSAS